MLEEFLNKDREIILTATRNLLNSLEPYASQGNNALLVYYSLEDKNYSTTSCRVKDIILETKDSDDYSHRQYIIVNLSKDEETKILTLIAMGIDIKEIIISFIKEDNVKWLNYKDYDYD